RRVEGPGRTRQVGVGDSTPAMRMRAKASPPPAQATTMRLAITLFLGCAGAAAALLHFGAFPVSGLSFTRSAATTQRATPLPVGAVKVTTAEVLPDQVPIYLSGIGTVQAYNTVSVKSRVDGDILKVM